jgi:thiamine pyrophosphokinase
MINPFLQDNVEASLLLNGGLLDFVNGDIDSAKEKIEDSLKVMKRWKKKHD